MAVRLGNIEPVNFMLGSKQVEELRLGEQLVWKRRLIEGVDYERWEYLRSYRTTLAKSSIIDTNIYIDDTNNFEINGRFLLARNSESYNGFYAFGIGSFNDGVSLNCDYAVNNGNIRISVSGNSRLITSTKYTQECTFSLSRTIAIVNDKTYNYAALKNNIHKTIYLFDVNSSRNPGYGKFYYFSIKKNGVVVLDLRPCLLSRAIPATLDSQGIAREAGVAGMVDEISGIFFGHKEGTILFSVGND